MGFTPACHIWSSSLISGGHNATHSTYSTKMISLQGFSWIQYSHTQTHSPLCTLEAWQPHKNISMLWGLSWSACLLISHVFSAWRENLESSKSWKAQWLCYTSVFHRDFSCCGSLPHLWVACMPSSETQHSKKNQIKTITLITACFSWLKKVTYIPENMAYKNKPSWSSKHANWSFMCGYKLYFCQKKLY